MLNIFIQKLNKAKAIKLENEGNDLGLTRHYPPASKEWFNSIYAYNKNTSKLLPVADKVIFNLIKSYFNLYSRKLERKIKSGHLRMRLRRLSTNRILVSRAELKHTSDKVIVTLYVYNRQSKYYINKIRKLATASLLTGLTIDLKRRLKTGLKRGFLMAEKTAARKLAAPNLLTLRGFKVKMAQIKKQGFIVISKVKKEKDLLLKTLKLEETSFIDYEKNYYKKFVLKCLHKEMLFMYFKQIMFFNKSKFKNTYLLPFKSLIQKVYNKKVEFNLVNLKYLHLNSDIFTGILVTKLKNRKNRLLRVLSASLMKVKLPSISKLAILKDLDNKQKKIKNVKINNLLSEFSDQSKPDMQNKDTLNETLERLLEIKEGSSNDLKDINNKSLSYLENTVFNSIKHKYLNGIRIEASGRLSRRITAARSVYKFKYLGNLKNLDSSYKGFSTVLLRGHFKSNLQHTKLKSKTRIGSFGLKGWVSSN